MADKDLIISWHPKPQVHAPALDLGLSKDGKRNAFYLRCAESMGGGCAPYAACLDKLDRHSKKKLPASSCKDVIGRGRCHAQEMREEEVAAGHSLFFYERPRAGAFAAFVDKVKDLLAGGDKPTAPAKTTPAPIATDYMAQAITAAMQENIEVGPKTAKPAPKAAMVAPKPGESMLEAARRILAERTAADKTPL